MTLISAILATRIITFLIVGLLIANIVFHFIANRERKWSGIRESEPTLDERSNNEIGLTAATMRQDL